MLNTEILSTLSDIDISTIDIDRSYVDISSNTTNIIIELFLKKMLCLLSMKTLLFHHIEKRIQTKELVDLEAVIKNK